MPIHDFRCSTCHKAKYDFYLPLLSTPLPECCNAPMERLWTLSTSHKPFEPFTFETKDGPITISSLGDIRRIEAESLKAYTNGVGQPYIFRHYTQDHNNREKNVFGDIPEDARVPKNPKVTTRYGIPE